MTEDFQDIDGTDIHYYYSVRSGTIPFMLVHGIAVSSRYMLPLARELAKTNSVYVLDLPGFGKSGKLRGQLSIEALATTVHGLILKLQLEKPVIVANSFGCQVALKLIKQNPAALSKAIMIGPTMNIYERSSLQQSWRWLQNIRHEPTIKMSFILIKDVWDCGLRRVFKTLKLGVNDQPEAGLKKVTIPILFIRGGNDPIAPIEWLQYLVNQNKRFKLAELPEAGHALNYNAPKPLAKLIWLFVHP